MGFNKNMTKGISLGKKNNQNITALPMGKIKDTLAYMCKESGIEFFTQEESYTSKASFRDRDKIKKGNYSGKRIRLI